MLADIKYTKLYRALSKGDFDDIVFFYIAGGLRYLAVYSYMIRTAGVVSNGAPFDEPRYFQKFVKSHSFLRGSCEMRQLRYPGAVVKRKSIITY